MTSGILGAVLAALPPVGNDDASAIHFQNVTVGDDVVLVELASESPGQASENDARLAGLAHRPPGDVPAPAPWTATPPGAFATAVVETAPTERADHENADSRGDGRQLDGSRVTRAVGIATLNALSAPHVSWRTGDPMALVDDGVETVVTVGLFRPAFRKFADVTVRVIERDSVDDVPAPDGVDVRVYTPAQTHEAMDGADVVFVTGSTLVYGGIQRYLEAASDAATVVCIGATASLLPEPLFDAGVDVVAGAHVTDPDEARVAIMDGACGTDLHDRGVRKVYAAREPPADIDIYDA